MSDPCVELQAAIRATLKADAPLLALAKPGKPVRVYDVPPTNAPLSGGDWYITIGNDSVQPDQAECIDGAEATATIDVWAMSDPPGLLLAKQVAATVGAALARLGDTPSHHVLTVQSVLTRYSPEADGSGHGTLIIQFFTEPST